MASRITSRRWLTALAALLLLSVSCGAKTGLLIPDASSDADVEADVDSDVCLPLPVPIDRRRAEVMFVIDRSSSMLWALDGNTVIPGEPSRWEILRDALDEVLDDTEHLLEYGAKFFPLEVDPGTPIDSETACTNDPGIDLAPAPENLDALLRFFDTTAPAGGTPTATALIATRDHLEENQREGVAQFIVLATDGGPNCNPDAEAEGCICTGPPDYCIDSSSFYNCLDDERTLAVIESIFAERGVPLFVIGIDNPGRPDLADFLDEMALAGGRPRPDDGGRRFYSVRREGDLPDALDAVTGSIARCLFTLPPELAADPRLVISLDGDPLPRDPGRVDGWDWTDQPAGELTIFGESCARASLPGAEITAELICLEDQ